MEITVTRNLLDAVLRATEAEQLRVNRLKECEQFNTPGVIGETLRTTAEQGEQDIVMLKDWVKRCCLKLLAEN